MRTNTINRTGSITHDSDEWVVVMRAVRGESHKRGVIVKAGLREQYAKELAATHRDTPNFNYWAMPRSSY